MRFKNHRGLTISLAVGLLFFQMEAIASVQIGCYTCSGNTGVGGGFNCAYSTAATGANIANFGESLDQYLVSGADKTYYRIHITPVGPTPLGLQVRLSKFDSGNELILGNKNFKSQYNNPFDAIVRGPRETFSISNVLACQVIWDVKEFCHNYPGQCN